MTLAPGTQIGKYEILEPIGAGGMGEVWKARDTTLQRDVAIKTLPAEFVDDPERCARLEREAKLLASLNHPNIAGIRGLERSNGTALLELELVEGRPLSAILEAGPVPVRTALEIAVQIAEALEAAHAKNIVHRDLKPGNVMLTPEGDVKVLDFGLAKTIAGADPSRSLGATATMSAGMTQKGAFLGTPAYMSPEQVRGGPVDAQTDIWAFGCILFEMLTGWSPFARASATETLGKVLEREPELESLPPETPAAVRRLIRRCLEKETRNRLHHIADARIEIREALAPAGSESPDAMPATSRRRWLPIGGVAALVVVAVSTASLVMLRPGPASTRELETYPVGAPVPGALYVNPSVAISPDGTRVAYESGGSLWLQTLGRQDATPIGKGDHPFFSSDGEWVAFVSDAELVKVSVYDRIPITIARHDAGRYLGGTWHGDTIVWASQTGLYRASARDEDAEATLLLSPPDDRTYAWPAFMPDGRSILLSVLAGTSLDDASVALLDLETGQVSAPLVRGGVGARYVPQREQPGGYLVYAIQGGSLAARTFDPETREVGPVPSDVPGVEVSLSGTYFSAAFDTSETGTLVHVRPPPPPSGRFVWIDHEGNEEPVDTALQSGILYPRVSPDGERLAFDVGAGTPRRRIWTMDLERGIPTQLSDSGDGAPIHEDFQAVWTRDGKRIYFQSLRSGIFQVWSHAADGSGTDERLVDNPEVRVPLAATEDDRLLVMRGSYDKADIGLLDPADPSVVDWLIETPFSEVTPSLSPDGHWMAYASNELGDRYQIYVQSFPRGDVKRRISRNGGAYPLWGLEGSNELYYFGSDDSGAPAMIAVTLELAPELRIVGDRVLWHEADVGLTQPFGLRPYDISPKDGRFIVQRYEALVSDSMTIWLTRNWIEAL